MEKTLVVSDQCPACKILLEALKTQGAIGKYHIINVATPEGQDMIQRFGLVAVPECIVVTKDMNRETARKCTSEEITDIIREVGGFKHQA
ncbi:hypothetical protein MUP77_21205 [Candidatus Bathyarchaeota archaeon]|nr:hypothetical protein [Candidatus Bathyarchaeota archaeon]